jgi:hypothetical protein
MSEEQFAAECEKMRNSPTIIVVGCSAPRTNQDSGDRTGSLPPRPPRIYSGCARLGLRRDVETGAAAYDTGQSSI